MTPMFTLISPDEYEQELSEQIFAIRHTHRESGVFQGRASEKVFKEFLARVYEAHHKISGLYTYDDVLKEVFNNWPELELPHHRLVNALFESNPSAFREPMKSIVLKEVFRRSSDAQVIRTHCQYGTYFALQSAMVEARIEAIKFVYNKEITSGDWLKRVFFFVERLFSRYLCLLGKIEAIKNTEETQQNVMTSAAASFLKIKISHSRQSFKQRESTNRLLPYYKP